MRESETIQVLGRGTDVHFTIDDSVPFAVAERSLREYLDICRGLYSKGTVSVNVGRRILHPEQLSTIKEILDQETGLTVTEYWCPRDTLDQALAGPEPNRVIPDAPAEDAAGPEFNPLEEPLEALMETPAIPETAPDTAQVPETATATEEVPGPTAAPIAEAEMPLGMQLALFAPACDSESTAPATEQLPATQPADTVNLPIAVLSEDSPAITEPTESVAEIEATPLSEEEEIPETDHPVASVDGTTVEDSIPEPTALADDLDESSSVLASLQNPFLSPMERADRALIIKNTCRSGEVIRYPGDVVVFGDVNPGAEIVADGDVIVLGSLRGMAHAGAGGNLKSTIFALNLDAHRLQIGPHSGEAPRTSNRSKQSNKSVNPRIAYVRRGSIYVVPFTRRSEQYQGGILYEG